MSSLEHVLREPFVRMTYTEAVDILTRVGRSWEYPVQWGTPLQSEHERTVRNMDVLVPRVGEIIGGTRSTERGGSGVLSWEPDPRPDQRTSIHARVWET